ncbi:hypothetical protein FISHEDRAFT_71601 [Fistulina hepatica ATCC 64428]|uniref:Uncharacterized protein n=1 Tax=Fistulina hepatica ATCC 64428 TaxID=1128425 RepID=A0A0D7AHC9_9AGAR|nr:hypothetical protein FISHEDRAFT_71601 [Fistulina hepatica ATCC 64428]
MPLISESLHVFIPEPSDAKMALYQTLLRQSPLAARFANIQPLSTLPHKLSPSHSPSSSNDPTPAWSGRVSRQAVLNRHYIGVARCAPYPTPSPSPSLRPTTRPMRVLRVIRNYDAQELEDVTARIEFSWPGDYRCDDSGRTQLSSMPLDLCTLPRRYLPIADQSPTGRSDTNIGDMGDPCVERRVLDFAEAEFIPSAQDVKDEEIFRFMFDSYINVTESTL